MGDKAALIGWRWDDAGEGGAGAPGSARAFNSARTPARLVHEGISTSNLRKYFGKKAREKIEVLIKMLPPISFGECYHAVRPMMVLNVILTPPVLKICK